MACNCGSSSDYRVRRYNEDGTYTVTDAALDVITNQAVYVPKEEQQRRLSVCKDCDNLRKNIVHTCRLCGCIVSVKTRFAKSACPLDKWGTIEEKNDNT